jgi:hypothetical protein
VLCSDVNATAALSIRGWMLSGGDDLGGSKLGGHWDASEESRYVQLLLRKTWAHCRKACQRGELACLCG